MYWRPVCLFIARCGARIARGRDLVQHKLGLVIFIWVCQLTDRHHGWRRALSSASANCNCNRTPDWPGYTRRERRVIHVWCNVIKSRGALHFAANYCGINLKMNKIYWSDIAATVLGWISWILKFTVAMQCDVKLRKFLDPLQHGFCQGNQFYRRYIKSA